LIGERGAPRANIGWGGKVKIRKVRLKPLFSELATRFIGNPATGREQAAPKKKKENRHGSQGSDNDFPALFHPRACLKTKIAGCSPMDAALEMLRADRNSDGKFVFAGMNLLPQDLSGCQGCYRG